MVGTSDGERRSDAGRRIGVASEGTGGSGRRETSAAGCLFG